MPPKTVFSKDEIQEAAFKLFAQGGLQNVSVRKIASMLGSSTAPIYTSFGNMDEIREMLMEKALGLLLAYTEKTYSTNPFLNIGVGMLIFARENKMLYRTLFLENNQYKPVLDRLYEENLKKMRKDEILSQFSESALRSILDKMTFYTHGIAAQVCAGMLGDTSDQWFISNLDEMGGDIIGAAAYRAGGMDAYMKLEGRCNDSEKNNPD